MIWLTTPEWLPFEFDPAADRLAWLRMSEADYSAASFLDQRILTPASETRRTEWPAPAAELRRDAQYIFHIGNVGSTLISRLLGELPEVFALREPQLLRQLDANSDFGTVHVLLSRTWRPEQRAHVKATSFTSEIADRLVPAGSKALFLYASPERYLENILAGQNSWQTLQALSPTRLERLQGRCPAASFDLATAHDGLKAALGWACEMTSLERAAAALPEGTVLWLDFDAFLADPPAQLLAIAEHLKAPMTAAQSEAICNGRLMRRYSKALDYEYSPEMRAGILAEARREHAAKINDALNWLGALESSYSAAARAIRRARGDG